MALHGRERRRGITHLVKALPGVFLGAGVEAGPLGAGLAAEETVGVGRRDLGEAGRVVLVLGGVVLVVVVVVGHRCSLRSGEEDGDDDCGQRSAGCRHG